MHGSALGELCSVINLIRMPPQDDYGVLGTLGNSTETQAGGSYGLEIWRSRELVTGTVLIIAPLVMLLLDGSGQNYLQIETFS